MKILIILLVIVILLFVVLMIWGAGKNGTQKPGNPNDEADSFNRDRDSGQHSTLDSFNGILAPFGPTLKASALIPPLATFDLVAKPSYTATIVRDDKHKFRQAKFQVQPEACARVTYGAFDSQGADPHLTHQDSNDVKDKKPPTEFTLTILEAGGTLAVTRNPLLSPPLNTGPCKVDLK
jgi:hypothetical protein